MGTPATVSIKNNEGLRTIYCHYDGYLASLGNVLLEHYTTEERVNALIDFGDASSIYKNLCPLEDGEHTFLYPQKDTCVFYHRDRGESLVIKNYVSEASMLRNRGMEYNYLFKDGEWYYCFSKSKGFSDWEKLATIKEEK